MGLSMDLQVNCKPMVARLTERGCEKNQALALAAAEGLRSTGHGGTFLIEDCELDRLAACGTCNQCPIKGLQNVFIHAITRDIHVILNKIDSWDWERKDEEEQRKRALARWKRYNDRPEVKAQRKADRRIGARP